MLIIWCVTPVGYLPDTLWLVPSARDQHDLSQGWNFLCLLSLRCMYIFGSDPDQSGRIVLQGLVAAPRIIRLRESCSPLGRAGALVDVGEGKCPLSFSVSSSSLNCEPLPC